VQYKGASYYKFKALIGEGAVGKVFQVIHNQTSELFAIKRVNKQQAQKREQVDEVNTERIMLSKLKHAGITNMKAAWADKSYYYLLFDYAINGDYSQFLQSQGSLSN
jgi:p70 ribosomal S6 kinase